MKSIAKFEFAVLSLYKSSDPKSVEINAMLEPVKQYAEDAMLTGEWIDRDIGWFRVDIDKYPRLADDDSGIPDQMIFSKAGNMKRYINFQPNADLTPEQNVENMALVVRELTGDWFVEIPCEDIQREDRFFYDEVVYFGDAKDLGGFGKANLLNTLSLVDRYQYDHQRVGYFYNTDKECILKHRNDPKKNWVIFFNGKNVRFTSVEWDPKAVNFDMMIYNLNINIA